MVFVQLIQHGESSYPGLSDYHQQINQLSSIKASYVLRNGVAPPSRSYSTPGLSGSRIHHATDYGGDPTGVSDSTDALEQALFDAFRSPIQSTQLIKGVPNLGGSQLHLDGGTYKISRPLRIPEGGANFMIHSGTLRASDDFPINGHLIELKSSSNSFSSEFITLKDLMLDSNFRGGGVAVINSLRTTIDNCYISHFTTNGISIQDGHETIVTNSFIGQYINVGGDIREKDFSGIGININGNDNVITDVVIFSASIGVMVQGQANTLTGVHCYNKATGLGGTGIYVREPGFTQTRIINCYLDYTGIVAEDPVQLQITDSFFLGNAFIMLKSIKGNICCVNIVNNMFTGDYTGVRMIQLDESNEPFSNIDQVVVDRNNVRGMVLKSTVARGTVWGNGTRWTADFSQVLLFPNLINNVQYTLHVGKGDGTFPNHLLRNVSENRVTVESNVPVSATLHVSVDQNMIHYI
ncbi:hypothetical protein Patl1_30993 [Pistacia atlantica]|uniref:Uncharacterized protein n=1 Tax=Pistacia atlantica TaxID=434234 RepID=A0ACC1A9D1_9ROSI|nr:hypothetical protein Patl1_30993 [Pistacia atlantica]